jgi:thiol-disulfide isomerase/thioredoxin
MSVRSSLVSLVVLAGSATIAGCPKSTPQSVPTWDEGGGEDDGVMAAHDPAPDAADPTAAADPTPSATETAAQTAATEAAAVVASNDTSPVADAPADPPEGTGIDLAKAPLELPKVKHTKIDDSCGKDAGLGQTLKGFELKSVDGKPTSNKSFRNKVVLVNFWGTWCKPCLKELPEFDQLYRRYRKSGLAMVAIATDEDPAPVKEFIDARKISAKVLIGAEDYAGQYGSSKFPFSFVVDGKGVIRASYRGYRPECMGKLEADVRKQLEARAAK